MQKLKLEDLSVQSFVTGGAAEAKGTVHGHQSARCNTEDVTCGAETCNWADNTCQRSCGLCGTYYCAPGDETGILGCASANGQCQSGICNP
jgi:hypothetical protein